MRAAELLLSKTGSLGSGIVVTRRALDPEQKRAFLSKNAQTRSNPVEWSSELPQCDDLLLLFFAQDIVHLRVTRLSATVEFLFDERVYLRIAKRFTVLFRNLNLWVCGGALPKPQGCNNRVAFCLSQFYSFHVSSFLRVSLGNWMHPIV